MTELRERLQAAIGDAYRIEKELGGYYTRFVDLWKDADAELQPAVRDVRGRIARLAGER